MHGWILVVIILLSSIPLFAVYLWFRLAKYQFTLAWFMFALLVGMTAIFPALFLQRFFYFSFSEIGRAQVFYEHFVRIAFTEELSRLLMLLIFFWISKRIKLGETLASSNVVKKGAATGLVAGLGFAILENAVYGALDIRLLLLRTVTAAPLHAACGARVGVATVMLRTNPFQAILRLLVATAIHGVYNMMIILPGLPSIAAILVAFSALVTSIVMIRGGWTEESPQK